MPNSALKNRIAEEFWEKRFSGLKDFRIAPSERKLSTLQLNPDMHARVLEMCNNAPTLIYNFYATAFAHLIHVYSRESNVPLAGTFFLDGTENAGLLDTLLLHTFQTEPQEMFKTNFGGNKSILVEEKQYQIPELLNELNKKHRATFENIPELFIEGVNLKQANLSGFYLSIFPKRKRPELILSVPVDHDMASPFALKNYVKLLEEIIANPRCEMIDFKVVSDQEKELITKGFSGEVKTLDSKGKSLVELFQEQCFENGDRTALIFDGSEFTFNNLDTLSNQLASYLSMEFEVQKGQPLGICLERSEWMIVAILTSLKLGMPYVPIDPDFPKERKEYIVTDSGAAIVIDDECINKFLATQNDLSQEFETVTSGPDDLVYIIYTSGSTGRPKGCELKQAGVINRIEWMWNELGFKANEVVLQKTTFTFDVSVWEILLPLCWGNKMILCTKEEVYQPKMILELIDRYQVNTIHFVPSVLRSFISELNEGSLTALKSLSRVITSGEALSPSDVNSWYECSEVPVFNLYGPTEASVDVSFYLTEKGDVEIPIGRPIWNTELLVLGENQELLPMGVLGEICISGIGLSIGYRNNADLTSKKFIDNPYRPREKLYRTGDLGKWRADGNIIYLGRKDSQVKIRGHRIEPGEIEAVLQKHPMIENAVVLVKENGEHEKQLVSFYESKNELENEVIVDHLMNSLPPYMVVHHNIWQEKIKLTTSGKVDRQALKQNLVTIKTHPLKELPSDQMEEDLVKIWKEILNNANVGVNDNFFQLGGHSLKIVELRNAYLKHFGCAPGLVQLFALSTILDHKKQLEIARKDNQEVTQIPSVDVRDFYPVTPTQKRMWTLSQMDEDSGAYVISGSYICDGEIDLELLRQSFEILINRHEVLRTSFHLTDSGEIVQSVKDQLQFDLNVEDLAQNDFPLEDVVEKMKDRIEKEKFELDQLPLLRASIYQVGDQKSILAVDIHHIICDGWSVDLLQSELFEIYATLIAGNTPELKDLSIQYKDYTIWHLDQLENQSKAREYWGAKLEGDLVTLNFPTQFERLGVRTFNGKSVSKSLTEKTTSRFKNYLQNKEGTAFTGIMALLNVLVNKYSNQDDFIIGTPYAGRDHVDLKDQIGLYINTVPLRTSFDSSLSFDELFELTKQTVREGQEFGDYPFDRLINDLNVPIDPSRNPLFDIMLLYRYDSDLERTKINAANLSIEPFQAPAIGGQVDLTFEFVEGISGELSFNIIYNTDLFEAWFINDLASAFVEIADEILEEPTNRLSKINATGEHQIQRQNEFNETTHDYPFKKTLITAFKECVEQHPEQTALIFEEQTWRFDELDKASDSLCHFLTEEFTINPGDLIGVCIERGTSMIIALLAVQKLRCAYVPIDPDFPVDRKEYILQDCKSNLLIDRGLMSRFNEVKETYQHEFELNTAQDPSDLAYVIYTSGSTGMPKGCKLTHRGVMNRIDWMWNEFGLGKNETVLQKTNFTFDVSVWELFLPLSWGNTMVLCSKEDAYAPDRILDLIVKHKVNTVHFVPGLFKPFVAELASGDLWENLPLKRVITSGEALSPVDVNAWYDQTSVPLYNLYGPTEASIDVSFYKTKKGDSVIPIGQPIWNTQLYVLNENLDHLPIGVAGDIYIGGVGLATGYLNRPELTEDRFIQNPFDEKGSKLYKTGDLGKWQPDGNLIYLGRSDNQIKLRGYRIELGEIESVLQKHPEISNAVAMLHKDKTGNDQLVAFYTGENELMITDVREFLREKIPAYMVPFAFLFKSHFPLNSSGKIDRGKLKKDLNDFIQPELPYSVPKTANEETVANIFATVLGLEKVSRNASFFELGGDSIKGIQVVSRLRQIGLQTSVADIMRYPVLSVLAEKIKAVKVEIDQSEVVGEFPLNPIQIAFFNDGSDNKSHYNQSVLLRLNTLLNEDELNQIFDVIGNHHDALRLVFESDKQNSLSFDENKGHEFLKIDVSDKAGLTEAINSEQKKFDLSKGPLMKVMLIQLNEENYLSLILHHLVVDGVSWRILLDDLSTLYTQTLNKSSLSLPLKTHAFKDWVTAQYAYDFETATSEKDYWTKQMEAEILPVKNYQNISNQFDNSAEHLIELDEKTTVELYSANHAFSTDLNDLILTALVRSMAFTFERTKIKIFLEGHGREDFGAELDVTRTIGWFTSIYPVIFDVNMDDKLAQSVIQTKETLRSVPNKGLGYGMYRYLNGGEEKVEQREVIFNFLGDFDDTLSNEGNTNFEWVDDTGILNVDNSRERQAMLEISGVRFNKALSFTIAYNIQAFSKEEMEEWGNTFAKELKDIVAEIGTIKEKTKTPSDHTYKGLSINELDQIRTEYGRVEDISKLSPLQEGIFYHWLKDKSPSLYFEQFSYRLKGKVDVSLIEESYRELKERNTILRTSFSYQFGGVPLQIIAEDVDLKYEFLDLANSDFNAQKFIVNYKLEDENKGFDLEKGSQMRLGLIKVSEEEFEFVWSHHHILMDGWGMALVSYELFKIYESKVLNTALDLPPAVPYTQYVEWLDKLDENLTRDYWAEYLQGFGQITTPNFNPVKRGEKDFVKKSQTLVVTEERFNQLKKVASNVGITTNHIFRAIWAVLLSKINNTNDVLFGAVVSGRPGDVAGIDTMIGLFINTIPVRLSIDKEATWETILNDLKIDALNAEKYQYHQLAEVQNMADLDRDIFDHILLYQNFPVEEKVSKNTTAGEVEISDVGIVEQTNFDLIVLAEPTHELSIRFDYNKNVYADETVTKLITSFNALLQALLKSQKALVRSVDILNPSEKKWLLEEVNDTVHEFKADATIADLFNERVGLSRSEIALIDGDETFTYQELDQEINQLSNFLINQLSVKKGERVGVFCERGKSRVVTMMAIIKAGGTYLPIEPDLPEERIVFMLRDADIKVLLTDNQLIEYANRLQWRCDGIKDLVCVNTGQFYKEFKGLKNELMRKELWDHVGETTTNDISGGGWMSSYTGEYFSKLEMDEYAENAFLKLEEHLKPNMKVLEIGCSSGITMFKIAPKVEHYTGVDLSSTIVENTRNEAADKGLGNVSVQCLPAHEIDQLNEDEFDLVIINSVIHCFNGHNYFLDVLDKAITKCNEKAILFLGDLLDEEKRDALVEDMIAFKSSHPDKNYRTKTDWSAELFIAKDFLKDLSKIEQSVISVDFSDKIYTVENELTKFRYDAIVSIDKLNQFSSFQPSKRQHDLSQIKKQVLTTPEVELNPEDDIYVIYTSGSTGTPKGCILKHSGVVNRIDWMWYEFGFEQGETVLQKTTYAFDVSVWEFFLPLCWGNKMVIAAKEDVSDPERLIKLIERYEISTMHFVPGMLKAFLAYLDASDNNIELNGLKRIITSGEALPSETVKSWYGNFDVPLHNLYGPTEASIDVTYYTTSVSDVEIPIGAPIWNTQLYVLNEDQQLVPPGVPGEICIAGVGLASGYLNRNELTDERFPQNPFNKNERIYRTGDLGRWREDGNLLYLGRIDHQVKIRGYRIELGEIENVLEQYPQVRESVLIVIENNESEKDLVAYYVAEEKIDLDDLRNHLSTELPAYMIPSFYVHLTEMPLTSNGKVNRKKLPHFDGNALFGEQFTEPVGETEISVSKVFEDVLNLNRVSTTSSFFLIGGDSIKAIRLISQINSVFETSLTIGELYANNTVQKLAEFIEQNKGQKRDLKPIYERFGSLKKEVLKVQSSEAEFKVVDAYPMSDIEKGMVFESLVSGNDGTYHDQFVYEVHFENFSESALKKALEAMVQKHPKLRSGYNINDFSTFAALIYDKVPLPMEVIDLSEKSELEQKQLITKHAENSRQIGFDIENFPLWKLNLFMISETDQVLLWEFHHAILDGWSSASFVTELNNFYIHQNLKGEVVFDDLKIAYKDFVAEEIYNNENQTNSDFWKNELETHEPIDILNTEEEEVSYESSKEPAFFDRLEQTASELKTTVKSLAFTAYLYTIHSLVYQPEITVGIVSNTRPAKEDGDKILGCFLNTLPFNITINESERWSSLIRRVDEKLNAIKEHELTLFKVGEIVGINRNRENPFFDTFFNYVDFHVFNGLKERDKHDADRLGLNKYQKTNTNFDIDVDVTDRVFTLFITQSLKLKSGISAETFGQKYFHVLEQILHNPEQHANGSFLLTDEIDKINTFNNKTTSIEGTVLTEFGKVALESSDNTALLYEGQTYNYADLHKKSSQFAQFLIEKQVGEGDFVAIKMERSDALVISILGVLKAGAAYVPIDVSYPDDRIAFIRSDSKAKLMVDDKLWANFLEKGNTIPKSKLPAIDPASSAYVIYTSGTTGVPKGVVISHEALQNYLCWARNFYGESSNPLNFGLFTSIAFDLTVTSLFLPLISGGKLTVFSNELETGEVLREYLNAEISHIKLTPAHINLIDAMELHEMKITHAVVGGDTLHKQQVEILQKLNQSVRIFNEYGPTESTVGCIVHEVKDSNEILIGKPIENTQISILNIDRIPCSTGVVGEIFISGKGLAKGYLNRPELTESSFTHISVFGEKQRRYASGDLGYWSSTGEIFYVGRKDSQLKINGFRMELAEVEAGILSIDEINEVVVVVVDLDVQSKTLATYFTGNREFTVAELRQQLGEYLPEYMIPSHFIQLYSLPLTTNGKIDKKALPPIGELSMTTGVEYQAPGNDMEARMIDILSDELNQNSSTIGVNDNFFDIGADSIRMMRILSRVNRELELDLKIVTLFEYTTVALLVEHILDRGSESTEEPDNNISDELDEVFDFMED